jgi:hypothetical protein
MSGHLCVKRFSSHFVWEGDVPIKLITISAFWNAIWNPISSIAQTPAHTRFLLSSLLKPSEKILAQKIRVLHLTSSARVPNFCLNFWLFCSKTSQYAVHKTEIEESFMNRKNANSTSSFRIIEKIYYSNPTHSQCMEKMHCVIFLFKSFFTKQHI